MTNSTKRPLLCLATSALMLAGCAVGPDFTPPVASNESAYTSPEDATKDNGPLTQKIISGKTIPAAWWELFQSKPLNDLIRQAVRHNPDLTAAEASLRVAEENAQAADSLLMPTVSGSLSTTREKTSGATAGGIFPGQLYTLHNTSLNVSYGLDVFGLSRRTIEAKDAKAAAQRYQMEAAYVSLTANVATAAMQEAALRAQIAATERLIKAQTEQVAAIHTQLDAGAVAKPVLLAAEQNLAQIRGTLSPLKQRLAATRHTLSTLTGTLPSHAPHAKFELASLKLPHEIPVSLPSELTIQRPDIRAAEANLHAASAQIGVALASRLPQVTLDANIGSVANSVDRLFSPGSGIWSAGFSASQLIFDGGNLEHGQRAAEAAFDVAAAQYRSTVLTAFQNVADALHALQSDAEALAAQQQNAAAAASNLKLVKTQFDAGAINRVTYLDAEKNDASAQLALAQAEAQRYTDTVALFQALGGGWWNRPEALDKLYEQTRTEMTSNAALPDETTTPSDHQDTQP